MDSPTRLPVKVYWYSGFLVGGWADRHRQRPWQPTTMVDFYSVGKAIVGLLLLQLVDAGLTGLDDPIASVWPEFARGGKGAATVRHALSHQAGVPAIREPLTNDDLWHWDRMTAALAATEAWWEPGTGHAYHTNTYGHLVGEVIRRVSGEMPGTRLRTVAEGMDADLWFGVPLPEQHRCAEVIWDFPMGSTPVELDGLTGDPLLVALGYFNPPGYSSIGVVNTTEWRSAQVPSTNGHGTAAGVARFYAALLEPGRLIWPACWPRPPACSRKGSARCWARRWPSGWASSPPSPAVPLAPTRGASAFRHRRCGGVRRSGRRGGVRLRDEPRDPEVAEPRNRALIDALYRSL